MNNRNGIAPIALIFLVLAGMAVLGGVFYYSYQSALPMAQSPAPTPAPTSTTPAPSPAPVSPVPTPNPTSTPTSSIMVTGEPAYSLNPTYGPVGTVVRIFGYHFAATGNTILFNDLTASSLKNLPSPDGSRIVFTVPEFVGPNCDPNQMCAQFLLNLAGGGTYKISVISGTTTQAVMTFLVTQK